MGKIRFTLTADMTVGDFKKQIEEQLGCIAKIYSPGLLSDDVLLGSFASYLKGGEAAEKYADSCKRRLEFYREFKVNHPNKALIRPEKDSEEDLLKEYQENINKIVEQIVWEYNDISTIGRFMEAHFDHYNRVSHTLSLETLYYSNLVTQFYGNNISNHVRTSIYLWKKDEPHCFHPNDTFVVVRKLCGKA